MSDTNSDLPKKNRARKPKPLTKPVIEAKLASFLEANPGASVEGLGDEKSQVFVIRNPWNDPSIFLVLTNALDKLGEALNNVVLPERYSAIYHKDRKEIEVAWTAYKLSPQMAELVGRKFKFLHRGKEFECEFTNSSARFMTIALHFVPIAASLTAFRNLPSFQGYRKHKASGEKEGEVEGQYGEPICFFIRGIEWNDNEVLEVTTTLNFYLKYFDSISPTIVIHSSRPRNPTSGLVPRYASGVFPELIRSNGIDENLLNFWHASTEGDSGRRFVYSFRIIEYASHAYVKAAEKFQIKRMLSTPDAFSNLEKLSEELISKVNELKPAEDTLRFNNLISEVVKADVLWSMIEKNFQRFSNEIKLDGGFCIPALIASTATIQTFKVGGLLMFANTIRKIRNHLSHGRDQNTGHMIAPTPDNFEKLEPWAALISLAANEIMLYLHLV